MRIAVVGVGAVGGYFGGRLAQAGHEVIFLARGETLAALQTGSLHVKSIAGDFTLDRPKVTNNPLEIQAVDLVLPTVKASQLREAIPTMVPLVGPDTVIIPLQNGLEAPSILAATFGPKRVLGGLCKIFAMKTGPAEIEHIGLEPTVEFGEIGCPPTERVRRIREAFESAQGMRAVTPDNITAAMWEKLLYVEPLGAVGAVTREPAGVIRAVAETRRLLRTAMEEVVAVALKRGVALDPELPERAIQRVDELPAEATASMQRDMVAGRPSEFEFQTGTVVRYGQEAQAPTPAHSIMYAALLPGELRARGQLILPPA